MHRRRLVTYTYDLLKSIGYKKVKVILAKDSSYWAKTLFDVYEDNTIVPTHIVLSKDLHNVGVDKQINTIMHELAHLLVTDIDQYNHGHDLRWHECARMLGSDGFVTNSYKR